MSSHRPITSLAGALPAHRQRVERRRLAALDQDFTAWLAQRDPALAAGAEAALPCAFLIERIGAALERIRLLRAAHGQFVRQLGTTPGFADASALHLMSYARALGARGAARRADRAALARDFGPDALAERMQRQVAVLERDIGLAAAMLALHAATALIGTCSHEQEFTLRWRQIGVEDGVGALLTYEGNLQVQLEGFRCLASALSALPAALHAQAVSAQTTQFVFRLAQEPRRDIWLQGEALALLARVAPEVFAAVARRRLAFPAEGDDLFVRRRCVELIAAALDQAPQWSELLLPGLSDPSPYVRQALADALPRLPGEAGRRLLGHLLDDREPAVQAQALLALPQMLEQLADAPAGDSLHHVLTSARAPFACRVALLVAERCVEAALAHGRPLAPWAEQLLADADRLAQAAEDLRVRQWAAETAEWLTLHLDPGARSQFTVLAGEAAKCAPGGRRSLPASLAGVNGERLGRIAQVLVRRDFGLHFERRARGWRMQRGHRFGFRSWRLLHELRHPSPDKRQAFRHTVGRIFRGTVHAPSGILAELSRTKVPGEPLQHGAEAGWRNWLPLTDQLISLLDEPACAGALTLHSPFGVTRVRAPDGLAARLRARTLLTLRFARYAELRNWTSGSGGSPDSYARALARLGFELQFEPYPGRSASPAVQRFFAGVPAGDELLRRMQEYFFSAYQNTLYDLALFIALAMAGFVGRHAVANVQLRRARAAIPLVVGGWGTRGKSGTERLKAALFNGLGYGVVSKTTGCEAMFLYSAPYQPLREMFLFRPYDKATIWEQHQVTRLAQQLEADVMLWECMALTPEFVRLLQKRWMRDDLATITNTFPDHEDIQGPAGIDLPDVMGHFIPDRGTLITTEEQMRPILAEAARRVGSRLIGVGWLESGLLTPDVLARFPYQEHPDNIALVLRMAAELDIPADFALREMADRVVPDLGVLKVFPPAWVDGRQLSFANGMSANERFGCLGNWTRLGFDRVDPEAEPQTIVSAVVNNRADRIARSRVFAGVLVNDLAADRIFLIGNNLEGLTGYLREAWDERAAELTLRPGDGQSPLAVLEQECRRMRLACSEARLRGRLKAMLAGCALEAGLAEHWQAPEALAEAAREAGCDEARAAELARFHAAALAEFAEYRELAARIDAATDEELHDFLWRAFERKLVVVWDYHASGNRVIQILAAHTPPGLHNRVMGIQNIKGTGLDFVYRWLAWDRCHRACEQLASREAAVFREGLRGLAEFQEFGLLTEHAVRAALALARSAAHAQTEHAQAEMRLIEERLERSSGEIRSGLQRVRKAGRLEKAVRALEGFVDAGDAVWRRRRANQIYADLVSQRISGERAAQQLLRLTQRQKGGWLYHSALARIRATQAAIGESLERGAGRLRLALKLIGKRLARLRPRRVPSHQRSPTR